MYAKSGFIDNIKSDDYGDKVDIMVHAENSEHVNTGLCGESDLLVITGESDHPRACSYF